MRSGFTDAVVLRTNKCLFLVGLIALALLFSPGCANSGASPSAGPGGGKGGRRGPGGGDVPVIVALASQRKVPVEIQVIGNVEAYSTVSIKAQVSGLLQRVHFREGDYVKQDDLLFTIDPSPLEAQLHVSEAELERNLALLAQSEATLKRDTAQAQYSRAQASRYATLLKEGIFSRDQTEQVQASADAQSQAVHADEAAVKSAQAAVVASRATVAMAKIQSGYTVIRAPVDGRTGTTQIKEGNLVAANQTELTTVNKIRPIFVTFAVPESQLSAIKRHMAEHPLQVRVRLQSEPGNEEIGSLTFVDNTVDTSTGTIKLKGTFANSARKLWPGQFVRVTLRLTTQLGAVVVPNQAVQTGQNGSFVYVVKPDRTVESRPVVTGARLDQDIVMEQGLQSGETVVTEGQLRLGPGSRVAVRDSRGGPRRPPRT